MHTPLTPTLVTLIVATVELVVCLFCAVVLWRQRRGMPDHSRLMLALGAAHCVVTSVCKYCSILTLPTAHFYYEVLSMSHTRWGMLSVLLMLAYPVSVARPEWLRSWRGGLLYLLPGLLLFVAPDFFPEVHRLYSLDELLANIGEPDIVFRLAVLPLILLYCSLMMGRVVNLSETGGESLWLRRYIAGVMGLLLLVSTFTHTHIAVLHYLHQLCVAAFYGYWTYYELMERVYTAPAKVLNDATPDIPDASLPPSADEELQRFRHFDEQVERRLLYVQPGISRDELCRVMSTDRTTFSRIITEQSGQPNLSAYLNQKRMRRADLLMREHPNYSIEAIMQDCGYQSKTTFNRIFKDFYGTTPSEYRRTLPPTVYSDTDQPPKTQE
ncbi:MAG: AraC family transcriptional regulator [Prevotella sp.]|nr:AraC family transcriptional regulator [Prevotella sp.]